MRVRVVRTLVDAPVEGALIALVCAFELGGLAGRWPTITTLVRPLPRPARAALVTASCGWFVRHMGPWR